MSPRFFAVAAVAVVIMLGFVGGTVALDTGVAARVAVRQAELAAAKGAFYIARVLYHDLHGTALSENEFPRAALKQTRDFVRIFTEALSQQSAQQGFRLENAPCELCFAVTLDFGEDQTARVRVVRMIGSKEVEISDETWYFGEVKPS